MYSLLDSLLKMHLGSCLKIIQTLWLKKKKTGEMLSSIDSNAFFSFTFDKYCMPTYKAINFVIKFSLQKDASKRKHFINLHYLKTPLLK